MTDNPNLLNPHYDFKDQRNLAEIDKVKAYDKAFKNNDCKALEAFEKQALTGQVGYVVDTKINSPWGDNVVLDVQIGPLGANKDVVKKEITIKPGFMLSLQRHRGRKENWTVIKGVLNIISDAKRVEIRAGQSISLPKGNVHCLINTHDEPVTFIEIQTGTCREADNVRLIDFNNRATYPLTSVTERKSAFLYAKAHAEIQTKFGCEHTPNTHLLGRNHEKTSKSA